MKGAMKASISAATPAQREPGFLALQPTARVERLRRRYLDMKNTVVNDRARIEVRVMKETEAAQ